MVGEPGSRRDQASDDDVLLQAAQGILLAGDRGFGEHPGGLLERSRRYEGLRGQGGLGDAEQHTLVVHWLLVLLDERLVDFTQARVLDLLTADELGIAGPHHLHLAQHLPHDHLDVLVVDLHPLQAIDLLDLVDDVLGEGLDTVQADDVVGAQGTMAHHLTLLNVLAFKDIDAAPFRNQGLHGIALGRGDHQPLLALGGAAETDHARSFGEHRRLLGLARLKEVRHPRQAAGDVPGLGALLGNAGYDVADMHRILVLQIEDGVAGQGIGRILGRIPFPRWIGQHQCRTQILARGRAILGVENGDVGQAGQLVGLTVDRVAFLHVLEFDDTLHLGDDRVGVRIPTGNHVPGFDGVALGHRNDRAVGQLVALPLPAMAVSNGDFAGSGNGHQLTGGPGHRLQVVQANRTAVLNLDAVDGRRPGSRAADVEGAHGELGARFADGLRGNDAHRLADVDPMAASQVASVAGGANPEARLAGDGRAHRDLVDAEIVESLHPGFIEHVADCKQHLPGLGIHHVGHHDAAQHPVAQGLHHVTAFDDGGNREAVAGAAVQLGDDNILRHVHQAPGQVPGTGRLKGRIRQPLAGAVGGDEVLIDVEPLTEVGRDGIDDDRPVRAGHQAPHARQLANLRRGTPSARVRVDEHRVEGVLLLLLAVAIDHRLLGDAVHHRARHQVIGPRPDVNHLVVLLTL